MNEAYIEQLVKKKWELSDTIMTALIVFGALVAMGVSAFLTFTEFYSLIIVIFAVISYFACRFITNLSVEYEYCLVSGELTVDKIINKRKRKRVITVQVRNFERFAKYDGSNLGENVVSYVKAGTSAVPENGWVAQFNKTGIGRTVLVFSPNEKMINAIKPYLKAEVRLESFAK